MLFDGVSLRDFYMSCIGKLLKNYKVRTAVLELNKIINVYDTCDEEALFLKVFTQYVEEAELTLSLLSNVKFDKDSALLEVGSGIGLVYGYLKSRGFNIYGAEPSEAGFYGYYEVALEIFKTLDIDPSSWHSFSAEDCPKINIKFDVIFSNNVLEHIHNLDAAFSALKIMLKPNGLMIHNTINYLVPYDPHLRIVLFPFAPRITVLFKPALKKSPVWCGLNFITTVKLKRLCRHYSLNIAFEKNTLVNTFRRFDICPEFASRQKSWFFVYKLLKSTGAINLLHLVPASLTTPIVFTIKNKAS